MKIILESTICKLCGSENVIRFGRYNGIQRWKCKDCQRKFADNNALPGMRIPHEWVSTAIGAYYIGRSLTSIPEVMYQLCGDFVTKASIDKWVARFSKIAIAEAAKARVTVGDIWLGSENSVKIGGKNYWVIDIIDIETKFLLATRLSYGRTSNDFKSVLEAARDKANKIPERILTNDWKGYANGIELVYGQYVEHIPNASSNSKSNFNRLNEYWHNTLKARNKVLSRLKTDARAQLVLDGWLVNYNYLSIQEALNGRTPAEVAKSDFKYRTWLDLICQSNPGFDTIRTQRKRNPIRVPERKSLSSSRIIKEFLITNAPHLFSQPSEGGKISLSEPKPKSNRIFRIIGNI
ncbi:MAG: DDE-type integrase/transposase/recombinase [Dehalococcoidales bacterium]|nr:DDE-type integrase/transposase/recombinase [Dehalococcoidales bacterium]